MEVPQKYLAAAQDAQRRLEAGDARGAIQIGQQILQVVPNYPAVHTILGRAFRLVGETEHSLARFRRAAELAPKDATRWAEFVDELLKDGQKGRARKVAQKAPLKGPEKKQLLDLARKGRSTTGPALGGADQAELAALQSLVQTGQMAKAKARATTLLETHPESAFLHNIIGIVALTEGDARTAESCFRKTLELSPQFSGAAANLGLSLIRQRQYDAAIEVLRSAVGFDPKSIEARTNLANAYLDAQWHQNAFDETTAILSLDKTDTDALMIRASAATSLGRFADVDDALDRIEARAGISEWSLLLRFRAKAESDRTEAAIAFAETYIADAPALATPLARLKSELGLVDEARQLLRDFIATNPADTSAYFHYGASKRWEKDDPILARMREVADEDASDLIRKEFLHYALAKAETDLGEYDAAFQALRKANDLHGRTTSFDFDLQEAERLDVQNRWNAETIAALQGAGVDSVAPIFIVGMPRSGSTLIEHVIAAHPEVSTIGEDSFTFPFFPLGLPPERNVLIEKARDAAKEVRRLAGPSGVLLDKYLNNFQRVGILAAAFPKARFIQTKRDPRAIALSIFSNPMKVKGHPYSTRLEDIAKFYLSYHATMEHWVGALGDRIIVSDYRELVEDPEPTIRALIDRVGLDWNDACLSPESVQKRVKTLSVVQVRSGIHAGSVERWKRYEADLEPFSRPLREAGLL